MIPKPERDSNTKVTGKFYPLQSAEWVKACKELTHTQLSVLYYLRSADPYSNGMRIRASSIADELQISRQAVYKAIDALSEKEYIEKEDVEYSLKLRSRGCLCDSLQNRPQLSTDGDNCQLTATVVNVGRQLSTDGDSCKRRATVVNVGRQPEAETLVEEESQSSKINKTYSDFIKTLSEEERENFLNFVREKTKNLNQEVNDIEAWLAHTNKAGNNRWEVYYSKYLGSKQAQSKSTKNALDEHRLKLQRQCEEAQKFWEQSKNQNEE